MRWCGKLFLVVGFGCVFVLTSWHRSRPDILPTQLHTVYERLLRAEQRGEILSQELLRVLGHLQNHRNTSSNLTFKSSAALLEERVFRRFLSSQPNAFIYLPHLKDHKDSLKPIVHLGQKRTGVSLVLGVPTVHREKHSYLVNTLQSLLYDLSPSARNDIVIVVFVAETNTTLVNAVAQNVKNNLPDEVSSGLIEVISPSPHFYPDFTDLKETFGDTRERVRWRTKQNLDYSFLMLYAQSRGNYYVQLEDDIIATQGYYDSMKRYIAEVQHEEWLFLEFSKLGFIGKVFRSSDLPLIEEFILMFHKDKPIDWLLDHILWVKVCNPEKEATRCDGEKAKLKRTYKPSLFQHVGIHSSLPGKIQNLKDKDFVKPLLFKSHNNPPAELSTSLRHHESHSLERAYFGNDFFWGITPKRGDYVLITFSTPQTVKGYRFRSGSIETNGDRFYNTTVEGLPSDSAVMEKVSRGEIRCCKSTSDGFIEIGSFRNGIAEGELDREVQKLRAIRLFIHSDADVWVLLSEIFIKV